MLIYNLKIKIETPFFASFHSDTLFGHFCWIVKYFEGEEALNKFLKLFVEGEPPFLISDGFPYGLLPKPLSSEINITDPTQRKEFKDREWITLEDFNKICRGEILTKLEKAPQEDQIYKSISTHNIINRLTNTTLKEGGVYSSTELFMQEVSIYLKVINEGWKDKVIDILDKLSQIGYGRKKSIGKGRFSVVEVKEFNFTSIDNANGFVTLSNFCPAEDDPTDGIYRTFVKYGKLGEEFTFCGNPFKHPLLMIRTGSVFKTDSKPKEYYGKIISGISPAKKEVLHYAYAFAVPVKYPK